MNDQIKQAFDKVFGDMCLSDNDVALHIFEFGYKAGVEAEREACAKVCEAQIDRWMDDRARYAAIAKATGENK